LQDGDDLIVVEDITVASEGEYVLDLIMEPDFGFDDLDLEVDDPVDIVEEEEPWALNVVLLVIGILALVAIWFYFTRKVARPSEEQILEDEYRVAVVKVLKKHKRITQRDLRKELPFSEAKVSLVLAELEAEGKIKKIKKGRGNVVVWKP